MLIPVETRMSDFGYWVVTISCAPDKTMSIMVCRLDLTPIQAAEQALTSVSHVLAQKGVPS